ncbi:Polyketide synthase [Diaporthe amygdali]|uniref:Polyketide synthase n=1 Tax=Phomopsis amygdali TaxID=1214568 RepID=UPI0022FE8F30|nr:Polyketide synthase [Diaporthe amygdali]KAJ0123078.1 Polyketide synthase [Diaporthe amygdali]
MHTITCGYGDFKAVIILQSFLHCQKATLASQSLASTPSTATNGSASPAAICSSSSSPAQSSLTPLDSSSQSQADDDTTKAINTRLKMSFIHWRHIAALIHGAHMLSLIFLFTGQGAQYVRMGLELMHYPVFSQSLKHSGDYLKKSLGCKWDLLTELGKSNEEDSRIASPEIAQPICTALQVALFDLLQSWGISPNSVVGHSSGEMAAAYCAGALGHEEAIGLAYLRGIVSEKISSQTSESAHARLGMLSAGMDEQSAVQLLKDMGVDGSVSVGCVNSPINVTLTGTVEALDSVYDKLDEDEVFVRRLAVSVAYHSKHMETVSDEYCSLIKEQLQLQAALASNKTKVAMFSSVTGERIELSETREPSYWVRNLIGTVHFSDSLTSAVQAEKRTHFFVEIGPQAALRRPVQDTLTPLLGKSASNKWTYVNLLDPKTDDTTAVLNSLGRAWCAGVDVDIASINMSSLDDEKEPPKMIPDLPSYPFNHTKTFWEESRLSTRFAFRKHRRHGLLGLRTRDFNPAEASWRHIIRYDENPWILDHTLNGSSIYPGSGMIVMAVEALRQMTVVEEGMVIKGYRVKDVKFKRAINVNDSERGVEAQLHIRQRRDDVNNSLQKWYDWRVFTQGSGDEWLEAAYGRINVEIENKTVTPGAHERDMRLSHDLQNMYEDVADRCKFKTYPDQMYGNMASLGLHYGPFFARLTDIQYSKSGHATATLPMRDYADKMAFANEDPCVIHPTTLDALCHLQMAALSHGGWKPIPTMMFTHCAEMWISHKLLSLPGNPTVRAASRQTMKGFRECEFDTVAFLRDTNEPAVIIRGERGTAISNLDEGAGMSSGEAFDTACYSLSFRPDLRLLGNQTTYEFLMGQTFRKFALPNTDHIDRADAMAIYYVENVLDRLKAETDGSDFGDYRDHYVAWMRRMRAKKSEYTPASRGRTDIEAGSLVTLDVEEPTQKLIRKVGDNLFDMLTGKANIHEVIFGGHLVDDYYSAEMFKIHAHRTGSYIDILAHANPYLRILEVGAGTGSSAAGVLPFLTHDMGNDRRMIRISEYMYTDVSAGFFEHARQRFSDYSSILSFSKLDIEADPVAQGFQEGTYDVVIAGNVVHATSDLHTSLKTVRRLLKPGGKFIMVEICNPQSVREGLIFGLLPGWWLRTQRGEGETVVYPDQGPLLTESQWSKVLTECGFSGVDMQFRDHDALPYHRLSTLVATAVEDSTTPVATVSPLSTYIVLDPESSLQTELANSLQSSLHVASTITLAQAEATNLGDSIVISLLELDASILHHVSNSQMQAIKKISLNSHRLLWVTSGGGPRAQNPEAELSIGLGRTVCSERGDQGFIVISLDPGSLEDVDHRVKLIEPVLRRISSKDLNDDEVETELAEIDGVLQIPRVAPNGRLNDAVASRMINRPLEKQTSNVGSSTEGTSTETKPIRLTIGNPGLLDTLHFKEIPDAGKPLQTDEVEIKVMSSSINFKDVMIALGQIPGTQHGFGYDGSGVITKIGPTCKHAKVGDRVMFVAVTGAFATVVRVSELQTHIMPASMSYTVAASIPVVYCTALYSLDYVARLGPGETVLIHAGAGGVGQAAIQIAQRRGATIYVTAGSETKRNLLMTEYGVPASHIFSSRDATFVDDIMHATGGRGVDVVLNSLGGELLQQSWKCIKVFGRFVEIGKADILQNTGLDMAPFDRNVTFYAVDLIVVVENSKELMRKVMADVMTLWDGDKPVHEPRPLHVYPSTRFEDAMRYLQSGKNTGKTVMDWSEPGTVQYQPCWKPAYTFRADATYVLAGGLGGLPRAMVRWMISRGAKFFLLLSRSGVGGHEDAEKFLREVEHLGGTIFAPACDIAKCDVLEKTLRGYEGKLPPIKGCIQGAMVLHDELVEHMTADVWNEPLESKYHGSRNLVNLLPHDMDFLVMLSSFAGIIGNRGQSNYAAGNTYQDALARNLVVHQRRRAVSVNLGLILETGSANSNYFFVQSTLRAGFSGVTQEQLMALLDVVCDPKYDYSQPEAAQIVHVVDSPKQLWQKGHESVVGWMTKPLFKNLHRIGASFASSSEGSSAAASSSTSVDYLALVKASSSTEEAGEVICKALIQKLAKSLSVPEKDLDPAQPAFRHGVDSLIAVEVRYWFLKTFGTEVAVFNILKDWSMTELCHSVATGLVKHEG